MPSWSEPELPPISLVHATSIFFADAVASANVISAKLTLKEGTQSIHGKYEKPQQGRTEKNTTGCPQES
jgi:hypothetical protein